MTFADRVIRMKGTGVAGLSPVEVTGDPEAIASHYIQLLSEKETQKIRKPRASSLYKSCMRLHAIGTALRLEKDAWTSFGSGLTFGIGEACHYWAQNTGFLFGDKRRGWWQCSACNNVTHFGGPPKARCRHCDAHANAIIYKEHVMDIKDPPVTGHPDLFLEVVKHLYRVVEIKTITANDFPTLKSPHIDHEWQVQTYMHGLQFDDTLPISVDKEYGYVFYISKGMHPKQLPVKMFLVKRNTKLVTRMTKKLTDYQEGLKDFPNNLPIPLDGCAPDFTSYRSRMCPGKKQCINYLDMGDANG